MLVGVHHVAYVVKDMDEAVGFFGKSFGLELERREMLYGGTGGFEVAVFKAGNVSIELMCPYEEEGNPNLLGFLRETGGGLHHVAFAVEGLDESVAERLRVLGLQTRTPAPVVAATGWVVLNLEDVGTPGKTMRIQLADAAS